MQNRSIVQIESDNDALMHLFIELRKDKHGNCDLNNCRECIGD